MSEDKVGNDDKVGTDGKGDGAVVSGEQVTRPKEIGGPKGPEPTRYGDWEQKGRCTDF